MPECQKKKDIRRRERQEARKSKEEALYNMVRGKKVEKVNKKQEEEDLDWLMHTT